MKRIFILFSLIAILFLHAGVMSSVTIASKIDNHSHSHNYVKMHLQQSNALRYAKEQILKELNDEALGYISENCKDVNSWLSTQIESTIYTLKSKNG